MRGWHLKIRQKSLFSPAVKVQQRTPVITDPRIRGTRYRRLLASGSYWAPARQDLDTVFSKIDSRIIRDVAVIKGPYSARYGPGFNFIDFQFLDTPRYSDGPRCFSSTSLEYKTNGEQWYGRQAIWGGGSNYGYRVSYGHRTGNNYSTGSSVFDAGGTQPSSYNSRHLDVAFGYDLSAGSHLEFNYLRLDQTGVMFQLDLGVHADLGRTRMGLSGFHAWVYDYITYDDIGELYVPPLPAFVPGTDFQHVAYVNTDLATLTGSGLTAEHDFSDWLTGFALMSYVEGRDLTRSKPSRIAEIVRAASPIPIPAGSPRSLDGTTDKEPLPGIPPLEARLGLHLHQPSPQSRMGH